MFVEMCKTVIQVISCHNLQGADMAQASSVRQVKLLHVCVLYMWSELLDGGPDLCAVRYGAWGGTHVTTDMYSKCKTCDIGLLAIWGTGVPVTLAVP